MRSKKKLKVGFLPTLLVLVAMLVVACGGTTTTGTTPTPVGGTKAPASQQVYTFPLPVADLGTFDPALASDLYSAQALDMVFTGLVQLDDNLQTVCQLCQTDSVSSDGLTWTFTLKPNLVFSDGTALTSADVVYSINRAIDPATKSPVGYYYLSLVKDSDKLQTGAGGIKTLIGDSLLTPDANTVVIKLNKPATYFLDALSYNTSFVVEKSLISQFGTSWTDHLNSGAGGDGPFIVTSFVHNKEIDFAANPKYYGKQPQLQKVVFPFYKQADTEFRAYQTGQVDVAGVPIADLSISRGLPNGQFQQVPQLASGYFTMNYLVKPFDNIAIRQAFELAENKDVIAQDIYKGTVIPTNHIVPKGMPGYDPTLTGPDGVTGTAGDTTKAKALLAMGMQQEGWTSVSQIPAITLTYPSGSTDADNEMAALVQMWQNVLGISVKLAPTDFNKEVAETTAAINNPKGLQFWAIGWITDYPDPQDWTSLQFCKGCSQNGMNYGQNSTSDAATQQQVQAALLAADQLPNGPARYQAYNTAEQQLVNDVAWYPDFQNITNVVLKSYVHGFVFTASLLISPDDWGSIYILAH